jgi:hypothetical protein
VNGASVTFGFAATAGRAPARLLKRNELSGATGRAVDCIVARRPTTGTLTVTVRRPDFALRTTRSLRLDVR